MQELYTKHTAIIVDDIGYMRAILASILKHAGFKKIREASDGQEALKKMSANPTDICFCDWEMPGMSGLELFNEMRNDDVLKKVHFIMVTGHVSTDKVQEAIKAGIQEYIAKPFNQEVVNQKLKKLLG